MANFLTVVHQCKNFPVWKKAYDADAPNRAAAGLTDLHVLRETDNPNLVALMFGVSDVSKAQAFAASPTLADAMADAGVIGAPMLRFRHGEYARVSAAIYCSLTLTVGDYATALKAYQTDATNRQRAGLTDLAVLQLDDDASNILLLFKVEDVARATKFFDSPALVAHMTDIAGVLGTPERHFWKP
jgi:hypothetical protein